MNCHILYTHVLALSNGDKATYSNTATYSDFRAEIVLAIVEVHSIAGIQTDIPDQTNVLLLWSWYGIVPSIIQFDTVYGRVKAGMMDFLIKGQAIFRDSE